MLDIAEASDQDVIPESLPFPRTEYDEQNKKIMFIPTVCEQRYGAVYDILNSSMWASKLKKIVDYGCGELGFFNCLKVLNDIEIVLLIDVDETLLKVYGQIAEPSYEDKLRGNISLTAKVYQGSIGDSDMCVLGTDAVVGIEVIEHLFPTDLENLPYNIFGYIQPKLVIFTTPNYEYNVLFHKPCLSTFRHYDHKFEWTRQQFEDWANNIVLRYSNYTVYFDGIGPPPPGYEHLGYVTQMAVFVKKMESTYNINLSETSNGNKYKMLYEYQYVLKVDTRSNTDKVMDELEYLRNVFGDPNHAKFQQFSNKKHTELKIPIVELFPFVNNFVNTEKELETIMKSIGYNVTKNHQVIWDNIVKHRYRFSLH